MCFNDRIRIISLTLFLFKQQVLQVAVMLMKEVMEISKVDNKRELEVDDR